MKKFQILTLNNISHQALLRFTPARYTVGKHVEHPDAILVRSHDMHSMKIPHDGEGNRPCGHRHQQYPGGCNVRSRRAGVQRTWRQRECGRELVLAALLIGARNLVPALQFVAGLPHDADTSKRTSRKARSSSPASSCRIALGIIGLGSMGAT